MSSPTMADVGRRAGVSKATVSRVLRGSKGPVSPTTAARVRVAVDELGYVVNSVAASLTSQRTRTVGLIVADIGNPFFALIAAGLEQTLVAEGYSLFVTNTGNDVSREGAQLRALLERQADALVIATSAADGAHLQPALVRRVPAILIDSELPGVALDAVVVDNYEAARSVAEHLAKLGHRRLSIVTGPLSIASDHERLSGFRDGLAAEQLALPDEFIYRGDFGIASGLEGASSLLSRKQSPTAVFVANNLMTIGAYQAIGRLGLDVPRDLSLVGFDDMDWYPLVNPPITAVRQPAFEIGVAAGKRLLLRMRRTRQPAPSVTRLKTELMIRGSTGPALRERRV